MLLSRSGIVQRRIDSGSAAVNDDLQDWTRPGRLLEKIETHCMWSVRIYRAKPTGRPKVHCNLRRAGVRLLALDLLRWRCHLNNLSIHLSILPVDK